MFSKEFLNKFQALSLKEQLSSFLKIAEHLKNSDSEFFKNNSTVKNVINETVWQNQKKDGLHELIELMDFSKNNSENKNKVFLDDIKPFFLAYLSNNYLSTLRFDFGNGSFVFLYEKIFKKYFNHNKTPELTLSLLKTSIEFIKEANKKYGMGYYNKKTLSGLIKHLMLNFYLDFNNDYYYCFEHDIFTDPKNSDDNFEDLESFKVSIFEALIESKHSKYFETKIHDEKFRDEVKSLLVKDLLSHSANAKFEEACFKYNYFDLDFELKLAFASLEKGEISFKFEELLTKAINSGVKLTSDQQSLIVDYTVKNSPSFLRNLLRRCFYNTPVSKFGNEYSDYKDIVANVILKIYDLKSSKEQILDEDEFNFNKKLYDLNFYEFFKLLGWQPLKFILNNFISHYESLGLDFNISKEIELQKLIQKQSKLLTEKADKENISFWEAKDSVFNSNLIDFVKKAYQELRNVFNISLDLKVTHVYDEYTEDDSFKNECEHVFLDDENIKKTQLGLIDLDVKETLNLLTKFKVFEDFYSSLKDLHAKEREEKFKIQKLEEKRIKDEIEKSNQKEVKRLQNLFKKHKQQVFNQIESEIFSTEL